ncbi:MAG: IS3 family transposase, partial [Clostridia bacterium]|nr:IS3 family transposase [Clostridia bacterium]
FATLDFSSGSVLYYKQGNSESLRCRLKNIFSVFTAFLRLHKIWDRAKFTSRDDLISAIEQYLDFYNNKRYQRRLKCMTPMEFHCSAA